MKKIAILGCTGSIGKSTISVIKKHREDFRVVLLANNSDSNGLTELKKVFPEATVYCRTVSEDKEFLGRAETYRDVDVVVNGIAGIAGLMPSFAALTAGKVLATANKESLVCAGTLLKRVMQENGSKIYPLDSEHSAVWQVIRSRDVKDVKKIVLTASGGAFRDLPREVIASAPASLALMHPNWSMGKKVTIDCATLINKGMEIIEARHLFGVRDVIAVRHDESLVHALVEMKDNSYVAAVSSPDMKLPIQFALTYPNTKECDLPELSVEKAACLHFSALDTKRFPGFLLCDKAAERGDAGGTVLNAANEVLVNKYLSGECSFYGITDGIEKALEHFFDKGNFSDIRDVFRMDKAVREYIISDCRS